MAVQYEYILIRYGELTTKGKNRKDFINLLFQNTKQALKAYPELEYRKTRDRMYIDLHDADQEEVIARLKTVFGIHSFSLAVKCETELEAIKATALAVAKMDQTPRTFKVDTKRSDKTFPLKSMEISRAVAGHILSNTDYFTVDVRRPDYLMQVEVRHDASYLMARTEKGAGGYPVGVAGKGLLMLSGGIDSPVAGYLTMKRGVKLEMIHFASPPYTSEQAQQKVMDLTQKLASYAQPIKVHTVPFTHLQTTINQYVKSSLNMTVMRRMMYRVAEGVARKNNCLILTNGESIGQVASQTLHSMNVINAATSIPVIRPVATMDKLEIIDIAKKIDTYEISIRPFEDCCTIFTPKSPATRPTLADVEAEEARFDWEPLVQKCIDETVAVMVNYNQVETDEFADLF
ncbi:MAG: tRNA uracil 4-sulfurtransferase ThiI [Culicoidibacterales bacterium]